jgi:hypothetical protein
MGMFDYIRCLYPLPDGYVPQPDDEFQTKDTPSQYLDLYEIRPDGTLWQDIYDIEDRSDPKAEGLMGLIGAGTRINQRWVQVPFHGDLNFYTSNVCGSGPHGIMTHDDSPPIGRDYVALFKDGHLIDLRGGSYVPQGRHLTRAEWHQAHAPSQTKATP